MNETKEEVKTKKPFKLTSKQIVMIAILAVTVIFLVTAIIFEFVSPDSAFSTWLVTNNVISKDGVGEWFKEIGPVMLSSVIWIVIIYAVAYLLRYILSYFMHRGERTTTVISLFDGLIKYGSYCAIIILIFKAFGADTGAILASAGILTLVIGLGAQSLIADVLSGLFIIAENEYNVGEIIVVGDFRGTVSEIGIRSTKLLDAAGNIKIINNHDINNVVNLSRQPSLAVCDMSFDYGEDIEHVEAVIKDNLQAVRAKIPAIIEGPFYKGVDELADSSINVKFVATCHEEDRYQIQRDLNREWMLVFQKNNILIPYPQIVVNEPEKKADKATAKEAAESSEFIKKQQEASKHLENQQGGK